MFWRKQVLKEPPVIQLPLKERIEMLINRKSKADLLIDLKDGQAIGAVEIMQELARLIRKQHDLEKDS